MAHAYVEALREASLDRIAGAYLKGSLLKSWDSAIDYVPEISDVDVHVRCSSDIRDHIRKPSVALHIARAATERFAGSNPAAMHFPRPQIKFLDEIERLEGYVRPPGEVEPLLGAPLDPLERTSYDGLAAIDAVRLAEDARYFLEDLPDGLFDRPGRYLWSLIPRISWRVSPTGPRLLTGLGVHPYDAWVSSRTSIVRELEDRGHEELAACYAAFYIACWEGFRSSFTEWEPAHRALDAAIRLFDRARDVSR